MHTKNHEYCSQIECFMSQKPLAPKFLSQTVYVYPVVSTMDCGNISGHCIVVLYST